MDMDQEFSPQVAAGQRTKQMLDRAGRAANAKTSQQLRRLSGTMRSAAEDLRSMAEHGKSGSGDGDSDQGVSGMAASPVSEAARRLSDLTDRSAQWLETKDAAAMVRDVGDFARRYPARFLTAALFGGILLGQLSRGMAATHHGESRIAGEQTGRSRTARGLGSPGSQPRSAPVTPVTTIGEAL